MENFDLSVKVYPINEPQGATLAFASVGINDLVAIQGVRVVNSEKGLFVTMPQSQDKNGEYHDIAYPLNADLRKQISLAVLNAYDNEIDISQAKRSIEQKLQNGASRSAEAGQRRQDNQRNQQHQQYGGNNYRNQQQQPAGGYSERRAKPPARSGDR
jgi:DNA-binding cell septation regulator SpoVG